MKLLLFSDLHCDVAAARRLVELAGDVDVLVGAGDFANVRRGIEKTIDILSTTHKPAVVVAGNAEDDDELRFACSDWPAGHVLHGSGVEIDGVPFFGLGGAVPVTPFGSWSFDLTEERAADLLADCPSGGVLVTHSPPQGVVDVSSKGQHLGSTAILATIERVQPRLVVCGHIHDSAGQSGTIGDTVVVNAGPQGIVWDLEAGTAVQPSE